MAVNDPIADMLTRIRNACLARHPAVAMPSSRLKAALADVLKGAGYIADYQVSGETKKVLTLTLKYQGRKAVIEGLRRISLPSCRRYVAHSHIPPVMGGLGVAVLSTSRGLMTGQRARREKVGGELLCYVW
jgi:small subunit ribosomal protein S8